MRERIQVLVRIMFLPFKPHIHIFLQQIARNSRRDQIIKFNINNFPNNTGSIECFPEAQFRHLLLLLQAHLFENSHVYGRCQLALIGFRQMGYRPARQEVIQGDFLSGFALGLELEVVGVAEVPGWGQDWVFLLEDQGQGWATKPNEEPNQWKLPEIAFDLIGFLLLFRRQLISQILVKILNILLGLLGALSGNLRSNLTLTLKPFPPGLASNPLLDLIKWARGYIVEFYNTQDPHNQQVVDIRNKTNTLAKLSGSFQFHQQIRYFFYFGTMRFFVFTWLASGGYGTWLYNGNVQILINKQMELRCIQEVYFQPKMFETIGFHHQSSYNITTQVLHQSPTTKKTQWYPILPNQCPSPFPLSMPQPQPYQQQQHDCNHIDEEYTFHTKKYSIYFICRFDVSFNQQQFLFQGGCRWRVEVGAHGGPGDIGVVVCLGLVRWYDVEAKDEKAMISTENIIRTTLENQKDSSTEKIAAVSDHHSFKNGSKTNKAMEKVCQVSILIDTSNKNICTPTSMYQTIVFPNQQYFGKLYFIVNHTIIGYKARATPFTLFNFISNRPSVAKTPHKSYQSAQKYQNKRQLISKLRQAFPNPCACHKHLISNQITELKSLTQTQKSLLQDPQPQPPISHSSPNSNPSTQSFLKPQKIHPKLSSSQISPRYLPTKKQPLHVEICEIQESVSACVESLFRYYQCQDEDQLYYVMYGEGLAVMEVVLAKWVALVALMGREKWGSGYFQRTVRNFRDEIQYLMENKVVNELEPLPSHNNFTPTLKYKFYVHNALPDLYIHKQKPATKPLVSMSSQHILFVLVHGFNGNEFDMNRIKSFISYFCSPHFLVLRNISGRIFQDLDTIGQAAADEIREFVKLRPFVKRINFIGFSLGGVIIRASLPYLKDYHKYFNLLITLSSPHLGVKQVKNCIVKTGLQVLHKFRGAKNIKQLLLDLGSQNNQKPLKNETNQPDHCYLQKLSKDSCLNAFNLVLMCGSQDDKYVPGFSAILDYKGQSERLLKMQKNMKKNIKNLHQIFVKFNQKTSGTMWDRITGRRIHINFLDDDSFLYFLLGQYFHIF